MVEINQNSVIPESILPSVQSQIVVALTSFLAAALIANSVEEATKFIPLIGSIVGSVTSFATTKYSLTKILNEFEATLIEIVDYCVANKTI